MGCGVGLGSWHSVLSVVTNADSGDEAIVIIRYEINFRVFGRVSE